MARHSADSGDRETILQTLREQFELETRALDDLEAALQCEHQALTDRLAGQLDRCTEQKQTAMETLGVAITQRLDWMRARGLEPTEAVLEELLTRLAGSESELAGQWRTITRRLTACQELNEVNGRVLDATRESVEQLLGVLQSAGGPERGNEAVELYTARGKSRSSRGEGGNSLTKA
ncbi:MAG: flagella synthesis protein FlgN [Pseudomonadota bacterium]